MMLNHSTYLLSLYRQHYHLLFTVMSILADVIPHILLVSPIAEQSLPVNGEVAMTKFCYVEDRRSVNNSVKLTKSCIAPIP